MRNKFFELLIAATIVYLITAGMVSVTQADSGGLFSEGPYMTVPRMNHWIMPLSDGKVILIGGHGTGFVSLNTAEVWDPDTKKFTLLTMNYPHDNGCVVKLSDGRYLIAGGSDDLGIAPGYKTAEIYNHDTGIFTPTASAMTYPRMMCSGVLLANKKVLIVGGWYDDVSAKYGEIFDPVSDSFKPTKPLNFPRANPLVLPTNDGKAVIFGGSLPYGGGLLESAELYDPETNSFSVLQDTLFSGENGWSAGTRDHYNRPSETQKLTDGKYLFSAWKGADNFTLFTFNPETKEFAKVNFLPNLPSDAAVVPPFLPHTILDRSSDSVFLITLVSNSDSVKLRLYTVDLASGIRNCPTGSFTPTDPYYIYYTEILLLQDGTLFITGGHSDTGYHTNFTPVSNTLFVQKSNCVTECITTYDINGDGKSGLEEVIYLLQVVSGVKK